MISNKKNGAGASICSPETMVAAIREAGVIPFFENAIDGYSIEEKTAPEFWFTAEGELGPWDWKIDAVREGDIAYGKFLLGKSAFATAGWFRDLMNWRRSLEKYQPTGLQADVLQAIRENGSLTSAEVRKMAGLKKSASDALLTRLQMGTWIVIGDFERKFRGPNLEYSGWQLASWCPPEELFDTGTRSAIPFPFADEAEDPWKPCPPEESRSRLLAHLKHQTGAPEALLLKYIG